MLGTRFRARACDCVFYRNSDTYIHDSSLSETIGMSQYSNIITYCLKDTFSDCCFSHFKSAFRKSASGFSCSTLHNSYAMKTTEVSSNRDVDRQYTSRCAHTMESLVVKNKIMPFARQWMLLKRLILS